MPPPTQIGERVEPWRARPRPFCLQGLAPPPLTSPRVLVEAVPDRLAASWAVTTWCSTAMLGSMPNTSGSKSTVPFDVPSAANRGALISATGLHRLSHDYVGALGSGNGTTEQQQPALGVDSDHVEVEGRDPVVAHAAGHAHALEHPGGRGAGADRSGGAMLLVVAVGSALAGEVVALHHTGEAFALGGAGDVRLLAGLEDVGDGELLADLERGGVGDPDLEEHPAGSDAGLGVVALQRLVHPVGLDLAEGDLDGRVPGLLRRLDLHDADRPRLYDGDGARLGVLVEDLGHAQLLTDDRGQRRLCLFGRHSLISTSTPAGSSRRISESTVFGVGSRMSISRLWMRISKCSRESLWT